MRLSGSKWQSFQFPDLVVGAARHTFAGNNADGKTFLSAYFEEGKRFVFTGEDISKGLKMAATILDCPAS